MNPHNTTPPNSTLLRRLRTAINKAVLLLRNLPSATTSTSTWPVISSLLRSRHRPLLSLADRRPSGLTDACDNDDIEYYDARSASSSPASTPSAGWVLHRTISCPESPVAREEDDIDRKAEEFIQNFYRQLRLEKQISLELRYCRGYSFGSSSQISPCSNPSTIASPTS